MPNQSCDAKNLLFDIRISREQITEIEKRNKNQSKIAATFLNCLENCINQATNQLVNKDVGTLVLDDREDDFLLIEWFFPEGRIGIYAADNLNETRVFYLNNTQKDEFGLPTTKFVYIESIPDEAKNITDFVFSLLA